MTRRRQRTDGWPPPSQYSLRKAVSGNCAVTTVHQVGGAWRTPCEAATGNRLHRSPDGACVGRHVRRARSRPERRRRRRMPTGARRRYPPRRRPPRLRPAMPDSACSLLTPSESGDVVGPLAVASTDFTPYAAAPSRATTLDRPRSAPERSVRELVGRVRVDPGAQLPIRPRLRLRGSPAQLDVNDARALPDLSGVSEL